MFFLGKPVSYIVQGFSAFNSSYEWDDLRSMTQYLMDCYSGSTTSNTSAFVTQVWYDSHSSRPDPADKTQL